MPFAPGQSGNPSGRPKENAEIKALAREHSPRAMAKLALLIDSSDERVALGACQAVLDRGYGKPAQAITGEEGSAPLTIIIQSADPQL